MKKIITATVALLIFFAGAITFISPFIGNTNIVSSFGMSNPYSFWSIGVGGGVVFGTYISGMYFWRTVGRDIVRLFLD